MVSAVRTVGLTRSFGAVTALAGVNLDVPGGQVFGLLGPNGAGKTTLVRVLTTLLPPTSGQAFVLGHDAVAEAQRVRRLIGVALQEASLDLKQTARELLTLHGRLYGLRGPVLERQLDEVVGLVGLSDHVDRLVATYSGGMRRRLDLASALLHRPRVLFLDEPTTGLDPPSRRLVWERVAELRARYGTTVFLTTQYLEEADHLADRLAIVNAGRVVREGTPTELKAALGSDVIAVEAAPGEREQTVAVIHELRRSADLARTDLQPTPTGCRLFVDGQSGAAPRLLRALDTAGLEPLSISITRPTLDDAFFAATGGRIAVHDGESEPSGATA